MTTATNPGNYVDFDEYVGLKLEKTRSTIRTTDVLTALAGVAAMFLGYLLIFVVLDQWVVRGGFGVVSRWFLMSTLLISTIAWLVWKIGVPSFKAINGLFAAREIEKAEPGLKSNLLNLIDLKATGRLINPAIRKAMERQAAIQLQHVDVAHAVDHRPLVRTAYLLLAVIVIFCFYALLTPKKISNSIWRGLFPAAEVPLATVTEILDVKPGDVTVQAHQPFVDVQVDLAGEIPAQVWLLYSTADGKKDQPIELRPDQQGETRFKGQLIGEGVQGLMYDVTYFIRAGDATSRQYKITVEQPPYAEIESVRIEFPAYMKLQPIEQANNGAIDAWEGAKVLINAKTNMEVRSAMIQFLDDPQAGPTGEEFPMSVAAAGKHLQTQWTLAMRSDGSFPKYYRIHCRTEDGRVTTGHVMNPLTIRPDMPPEVMLMHPERDLEAAANATIALLAQARDPDFELGYLYLNVEKAGQKIVHDVLSEGRQPKLTIKHDLSLAKLNAAVGDEFEIWIEAYDNKQPRPNSKNTPKVKIRVLDAVSQKQAQEQLAEQKERVDQKLAEADQETNPDQADPSRSMDGDPKDRQPRDDGGPKDADPNQQANPQDDKSKGDQQGQRQKNQANENKNQNGEQGSGQPNGTQKSGAGHSQNESSRNQSDPDSKPGKPLKSDGTQDDEVLQRLNERMSKNNPQKPGESSNQQSSDASQSPQPANDDPQPNPNPKPNPQPQSPESKSDSEKGPTSGTEKPRPKSDGQQKGADGTEKSDLKEQKNKAADANSNPPGEKTEKDGTTEKPPGNPDKNPAENSDRPKPGDTKSADPNRQTNKPDDSPNGLKSEPKPAGEQPDNSSKSSGSNKPDTSKEENKSGDKSGDKPGAKSDQKDNGQTPRQSVDQPDHQDSKADSPSNKNLPTGLNKESTKESSTEKGDADSSKNQSTDPAKPDPDQNAKFNPAKNDNVKRDPTQAPETRPNQTPQGSSKEKPDKSNGTDKKENDSGKPKATKNDVKDQQDPNTADKSEDQMEGKQDGSKSDKDGTSPGKGKESGQDSKDAAGQKSADKNDASSGSKKSDGSGSKPGEGSNDGDKPDSDSAPKPESGESGDKPSSSGEKSDRGTPSASKNEKKSGDQSANDKKSKAAKPNADQSGGQKKNDDKSGDKSSDQSEKGESGKSESGKSDPSDGKSDGKGEGAGGKSNGKATGQKPSNKPGGPSKNGGNGGADGGAKGDGNAATPEDADFPDTQQSDDANLEYNRQASELILQKLKKDLDRGDVDPELLEQLGWTQAEMKQFADRLSKSLSESKLADETAEAKARQQQFQEMLKNLDLQKSGSQRGGAKEPKRDVNQVESKRTPPPPAYRSAFEKFTKDLARQKPASTDKSVKKD